MNTTIFVTRTCHHRPILESWLTKMDVPYRVRYVEDHPDIAARHGVRCSPTLILGDQLVFEGMPSRKAVQDFFQEGHTATADTHQPTYEPTC